MPFALSTAMVGGYVSLEGDNGGEAVWGGRTLFETGMQTILLRSLWTIDFSADPR
jgi:hypothetical protein